jgi:hypothetical protein
MLPPQNGMPLMKNSEYWYKGVEVNQPLPDFLGKILKFANTCADGYIDKFLVPKNDGAWENLVIYYNLENKEFHWTTDTTSLNQNDIIFNQFHKDSFGQIGQDPTNARYRIVDLILVDLDWKEFQDRIK